MNMSKGVLGLSLAMLIAACGTDADDDFAIGDAETMPSATEEVTMPPAEPAPAQAAMAETAQLEPLQDSGVAGEATVTSRDGQTEVMVRLTGAPANGNHPGHIHSGSCSDIGGVVQGLDQISTDATGTGTMTTSVDLPSATVMDGNHIIVYHGEGGTPVTCAEIPEHRM